jgi:hypothetical protein
VCKVKCWEQSVAQIKLCKFLLCTKVVPAYLTILYCLKNHICFTLNGLEKCIQQIHLSIYIYIYFFTLVLDIILASRKSFFNSIYLVMLSGDQYHPYNYLHLLLLICSTKTITYTCIYLNFSTSCNCLF